MSSIIAKIHSSLDPSEPLVQNTTDESQCNQKVWQIISTLKEIATINFQVYFNNNQQPRTKKPLKAKELSSNKREELIKTIDTWRILAKTKATQSSLLLPNLFLDHLPPPFYSKRFDIFESSFGICSDIHGYLVENSEATPKQTKERIFICKLNQPDTPHTIQAVAVTKEIKKPEMCPYLYIIYLASRPQNLISALNKNEPHRIAGAASKLMKYLAQEICPASNLERIELASTTSSKEFYKKLGFREECFRMVLDLKPTQPSM